MLAIKKGVAGWGVGVDVCVGLGVGVPVGCGCGCGCWGVCVGSCVNFISLAVCPSHPTASVMFVHYTLAHSTPTDMCTCAHTYTHSYTHVNTHTRVHVHTGHERRHVHLRTHIYTLLHACTHTHAHVHTGHERRLEGPLKACRRSRGGSSQRRKPRGTTHRRPTQRSTGNEHR